jgi:RHS repeat-associated protein
MKQTTTDTTVYVRDASGNVLSVYRKPAGGALVQTETHLYGSSRLGMATKHIAPDTTIVLSGGFGNGIKIIFTRAEKLFELANHLGNVLVTISDRRMQVSAGGVTVDCYTADVVTANDYYPFGMMMPGRIYAAAGAYRYGFNGKENDNEVKGEGNQQDYGMRIYDPRLGRFLSVDPLTKSYAMLTPYQFASNSPIAGIDLDGMEFLPNGESMFQLTSGQVKIKIQNVPGVYKDNLERPLFDAWGIGLTPQGKYVAPTYPVFSPAGYNAIPATPGWTFSSDDLDKDIYTYSEGTKPGFNKSSGWSNKSFKLDNRGSYLNSIDKGGSALQEGFKYYQLYANDVKHWKASSKLAGQINTFDNVVKTVDKYINMEDGIKTIDAFIKGDISRDGLVNFVMDGSLPRSLSFLDMLNPKTIFNNIQLMYYGMQIINFENNGQYASGVSQPWPWSSGVNRVGVSNETIKQYNLQLCLYKICNPDFDDNAFRAIVDTFKKD